MFGDYRSAATSEVAWCAAIIAFATISISATIAIAVLAIITGRTLSTCWCALAWRADFNNCYYAIFINALAWFNAFTLCTTTATSAMSSAISIENIFFTI